MFGGMSEFFRLFVFPLVSSFFLKGASFLLLKGHSSVVEGALFVALRLSTVVWTSATGTTAVIDYFSGEYLSIADCSVSLLTLFAQASFLF